MPWKIRVNGNTAEVRRARFKGLASGLESRADLKPKTRHQYQSLMRQYIMPTWRNVPLAKITFESLTHWVARLSSSGLGPSGIRQSVFVMSAALDHAVRSGRIRSNPARGLGLPRPKRRDYVFLTHGQVLTLADAAGRWRLLVLVLAYTGLRWGEATALRVCDIDFDRRRIDVRRAFSDVGGRVVLGTPKSHQSRTVPVPRFVVTEIAAAVVGKHADELVFTMPGGSVMRLSNWRLATFKPARTRAGLSDRFRIHDLRHTAASLMIQAGYPPKMLQEIMGHASITTTLTCTGTCTPERWTATPTGSMRRPPKVMRPKCGQTRTPTKPIRRSQGAELGKW